MNTRGIRGRPGFAGAAALVMLSLTLSLGAPPARADGGDDTADGWKKVIAFARCALNVFRAVTPTDWMVAAADCGRLVLEEATWPGGQP